MSNLDTEQADMPMFVTRLVTPRRGLFQITKTSLWDDDCPPVEGAMRFQVRVVDRRNVDDPTKIPAHRGTDGEWYDHGENHRVENGMICRDMGWRIKWFVEIADVMEFVEKHGRCVVSIDAGGHEAIEIYDDYRE